jgi:hypothetical protein
VTLQQGFRDLPAALKLTSGKPFIDCNKYLYSESLSVHEGGKSLLDPERHLESQGLTYTVKRMVHS